MLSEICQLLIYRKSWWYSIIQEICVLYSKLLYLELNLYWHNTHTQSHAHAHTCTCAHTHKQTINPWLCFLLKVASLHFQRKYLESTFPARKHCLWRLWKEPKHLHSLCKVVMTRRLECIPISSLYDITAPSARITEGRAWERHDQTELGMGCRKEQSEWKIPHGSSSTSQHSIWITIPILLPSITLLTQAGEVVPTSKARHCGPGTVPELESSLKPCSCSSFQ